MSDILTKDELVRWLKTEAHVMPRAKQKAFGKFLDTQNPPQQRLPFGRGKA
jgi:hypothetical protein